MKLKNQENSKKNQKPEFFKVNQKIKKYSKKNRKCGVPPYFQKKKIDFEYSLLFGVP